MRSFSSSHHGATAASAPSLSRSPRPSARDRVTATRAAPEPVPGLHQQPLGLLRVPARLVVATGVEQRPGHRRPQRSQPPGVADERHRDRQVGRRLVRSPEPGGAGGGPFEVADRGAAQRVGVGVARHRVGGVEVVLGDDRRRGRRARSRLHLRRHREVERLAVAARQRGVGDLADHRLHELVLPELGAEPAGLLGRGSAGGPARPARASTSPRPGTAPATASRVNDVPDDAGPVDHPALLGDRLSSRAATRACSDAGAPMAPRSTAAASARTYWPPRGTTRSRSISERTVSTANSGTPSARATSRSRTSSGSPATRPSSSVAHVGGRAAAPGARTVARRFVRQRRVGPRAGRAGSAAPRSRGSRRPRAGARRTAAAPRRRAARRR